MIQPHINLDYLDIWVKPVKMAEELFSILLYSGNEEFAPISRGPDDVVFRLIYRMGAFAKSHYPSCYQGSSGLPIHHQTESGVLAA